MSVRVTSRDDDGTPVTVGPRTVEAVRAARDLRTATTADIARAIAGASTPRQARKIVDRARSIGLLGVVPDALGRRVMRPTALGRKILRKADQ